MRVLLLFILCFQDLALREIRPQTEPDDLKKFIERIVTDDELKTMLFSYDYHGDHPLFIAYNKVVKEVMDTAAYNHGWNWEYEIDLKFGDKYVYLREHDFLFIEAVSYYLQFDSIFFKNDRAFLHLRTNTMNTKLQELFYFEGLIEFRKEGNTWFISNKKLREKNKESKW
ncbi:MAG: hypothetical protein KF845_10420 [Cyclobacteriaceae bacterium]|nr:hypothetical protein [Cyclobacteriaceae bacterium]